MRSNQPADNDESMRKLLREWQVENALPPRFQEQVWKRIADTETNFALSLWTRVRSLVEAALNRPVLAASYLTVLLLIGTTAGRQQGQAKAAHVESQFQVRYVQMVDPYQMPR